METLLTTSQDEAKECSFYSLGVSSHLLGLQQAGVHEPEIQFFTSLYNLLANRTLYTAEPQLLNPPLIFTHQINTNLLNLLIKGSRGNSKEKNPSLYC